MEPRLSPPDEKLPILVRIGWLVVIWAASVAFLGAVAMALRWWLV